MADVSGKFFSAKKVRTGVSPSSPGVEQGETLPPVNPPGSDLNSVGLSMPSAFEVANSPLTSNGTIAVTGAGTVSQYVRGDGSLADFPQSIGSGASVSYYLNGSVNQGTIGGVTYYEMNKTPIIGAGTDFTRNSNGYIASFLTDANDPSLLVIPAGNWNFETYFEASSGGGSPTFYLELYKYDGTTFSLIASNSGSPKLINDGTSIEAYFSALAVPQTTLTLTDRLAIRIYVTTAGRTITLHTENGHLCQVITTFTTGLSALNGLTAQVQFFAVGTSGTNFNIASASDTHTFNLPTASATNRGALSSADWSTFNNKQNQLNGTGFVKASGTTITYDNSTYQVTSEKGQPNGYASLDSNGKVPLAQINDALIGNVNYQGLWNAATNNPTLVNPPSSGTKGYYYIVSTAGTFAGISFEVGDWIISNGSAWQKVDNTDAVSSVFGRTGNVIAANGDYNTSQVTENTNLYYTEARVSANTDVAANTAARHNAVTLGTANGLSLSTQQLSLQLASGSQNGALSSTDWTTFNSKENAITAGTTAQYYRGDKTFQTLNTAAVPELTNLYYTEARVSANTDVAANTAARHAAVTLGTANGLSLSTQQLSLGLASAGVTGALSGTDWSTFNSKVSSQWITSGSNIYYNTGNVTIGGTSPTERLSVQGNTNLGNSIGSTLSSTFTTRISGFALRQDESNRYGNYAVLILNSDSAWTTSARRFLITNALNANKFAIIRSVDANTDPALGDSGSVASGTPDFVISSAGNVGINNPNPTVPLDVLGLASFSSSVTASSFIRNGGTSSQFLKADGSVDSNTYYLASNPSAFIALTALSGTAPIQYNNTTGAISITQASGSTNGFLSSTDWTTFNNKQAGLNGTGFVKISGTTISYDNSTYLTTAAAASTYVPYTGATSGVDIGTYTLSASNLIANGGFNAGALLLKQSSNAQTIFLGYTAITPVGNNTLNFGFSTGSGVWKNFTLSSFLLTDNINRTYTLPDASGTIALVGGSGVGTVTSVAALTLGTSGTDLSSTVANGTTTPVITLNVPTASATNRGALSAADWTTFNNKQNALTNPVTGTGTTNYLPKFTGTSTIGNSIVSESGSVISIAGNLNVGSLGNLAINAGSAATPLLTQSTNYTELYRRSGGVGIYLGGTGDPANYYDNAIHYFRSSGGGATRMTLDNSGNLGINTQTPNSRIESFDGDVSVTTSGSFSFFNNNRNFIPNAAGVSLGAYRYRGYSTGTTYQVGSGIWSFSSAAWSSTSTPAYLSFQTTNSGSTSPSEKMQLDSSGNLGLGVTPSAWGSLNTSLDFTYGSLYRFSNTSFGIAGNAFYNGSNWIYKLSQAASDYFLESGQHIWRIAPSGTAGNAISFTQAMTLGSNSGLSIGTPSAAPSQGLLVQGNVGIGVSPDVKLDVLGTSDTSDVVRIRKSSTGSRRGALGTQSGVGCLDLYNDSTELNIRLLAQGNSYFNGGNVGIGITNPQADLHVFRSGSTASITTGLKVNHECNADDFVVFFTGNESLTNNRFVMTQPGNIGIGTASPQQALHVNGIVLLENNQSIRWFNNASAQRTLLTLDSNNDFQVGGSISNIRFLTNDSSERVRIFSNGNVFIGASPSDNGARLQVNGGDLRVQGNTNLGNSLGSTLSSTFTTRLSGFALRADVSNRYGNYGVLIINSDSGWTSSARRFMITNGIGANKFGIIRSVDANTDPALGDAGSIASGTVDFEINSTGAATFSSSVTAASIIRSGGTSSQYLMADGSVSTLSNPVTGTGSAGQVAYWSSGSAITGESNLFWDATNDRLGIGRNNPSQRLDILGSGTVYANIENSGANIAAVITKNTSKTFTTGLVTDYWAVIDSTSGSNTRLMIESGGNVLINTTTNVTGANLNVNGNIRTAAPTGGSAENWKLGNAVNGTVNANRLIRVEIAGVGYDLVARQII